MFIGIWSSGTWPGPSTMTCTPRARAEDAELAELRLVGRVGEAAGAQPVAEGEGHVVAREDVADRVEVRVERVLRLVREHPLREERAAAGDDAGHAGAG